MILSRRFPIPGGTKSDILRSIKKKYATHESHTTALPTVCVIFWVATDAGLVIVDSGATETVGSPEAFQSVLSAVMSHAKVVIDVEAGRAMSFKLADGTTTRAYSLVLMQTPHGWFSTYVIESTGVPIGRAFRKLDSCCVDTTWKLSEWRKQLYSRITND